MLSPRSVLLAASLFALEASAFWRLPCRQRLVLERTDPIESPGRLASHAHAVHGAKNFGMSATHDSLRESECTSCAVTQDMSAYWTPNLYWEDADTGEFTALNQTGGMLVYYLLRSHETDIPTPEGEKLHIFPPDFRMIAGDARQRNFTWREEMGQTAEGISVFDVKSWWSDEDRQNEAMKRQDAVGFNCLNYQAPAEGALERKGLPTDYNCPDGLRAEIFFPSCWNGKDSDSWDHKDHVRYPSLVQDGECPEGFRHRLPSLFFETIWDIRYAAGRNGRLVLSDGDPTGYGYHGDFMNGWNQDILRQAVNECTDPYGVVESCHLFDIQSTDDQLACQKESEVDEIVFGALKSLPGCHTVHEEGPYAPAAMGCPTDPDFPGNPEEHEEQPEQSEEEPEASPEPSNPIDAPEMPEVPTPELGNEESVDGSADEVEVPAVPQDVAPEVPEGVDPHVVMVTVTEYHTTPAATVTVGGGEVTEIVTAEPVVQTVQAKRHRRRHAHGHRH